MLRRHQKTFDTEKHVVLVETVRRLGVDKADIMIIRKLHWEKRAVVRVSDDRSGWVNIEKGARQGCVILPDPLSLNTQLVMNEPAKLDGIKIDGRNVSNIRYADDMVLLADTEENMQRLMNKLNEQCRMMGLKVNKSKTEVMGVTRRRERLAININIEGVAIKQVGKFRY